MSISGCSKFYNSRVLPYFTAQPLFPARKASIQRKPYSEGYPIMYGYKQHYVIGSDEGFASLLDVVFRKYRHGSMIQGNWEVSVSVAY